MRRICYCLGSATLVFDFLSQYVAKLNMYIYIYILTWNTWSGFAAIKPAHLSNLCLAESGTPPLSKIP